MRSTSSPRAVSNSTGSREVARILRSTSNPLIPGSMTSSTARRYSPAVAFFSPLSPSCTHSTVKPSARRYSPTRWQSSTSSSITRIRSIAAIIVHLWVKIRSKELSNRVGTLVAGIETFDKTLLWLTVFLPLFPPEACSYQCTHSPGTSRRTLGVTDEIDSFPLVDCRHGGFVEQRDRQVADRY